MSYNLKTLGASPETTGLDDNSLVFGAKAGTAETSLKPWKLLAVWTYAKAKADALYAAVTHSHAISDVTNLQTALDGKAASSHSHAISDVTNLQTTLDGKAASSHSHAISDVTNLQTTLDGKAASSHSHAISDVTGLQTALDGKTTTTYVDAAISALRNGVSASFDTLAEIATWISDNTPRLLPSGGTSGQVLTKASGTNYDVSWQAVTGSVATDNIFDAKGDLPAGTANNTAQKLTAGANGTVLKADSTKAVGLRYGGAAAPVGYNAQGVSTDIYMVPMAGVPNSYSTTADRFIAIPVIFGDYNQLDEISVRVSTGVASSSARIGLYADAGGKPGALLAEFTSSSQIDTTAAAQRKISAIALSITPGCQYWWGFICSHASVGFHGYGTGGAGIAGFNMAQATVGNASMAGAFFASTYGALSGIASGDLTSQSWSLLNGTAVPVIGARCSLV